jgi:uncharacterized membrane protein YphA (DoxX/SURF4 family)
VRALRAWAALLGRAAAGTMLTAAGFLKLRAPAEEFAAALEAYRMLPGALLIPAARVLPWVEYLAGVYLLFGLWLRWTAPLALLLYAGFVTFLGSALARGLPLGDCGCFGVWSPPPLVTLSVDSLVVLLLAALVLEGAGRFSLDGWCAGKTRGGRSMPPPAPSAPRPGA